MKRMPAALVLVIFPCVGLIACAEQADEGAPAMEMAAMDMEALGMEMAQLEDAWEEAFEGGDAAALAGLYTADAIYMPPYMDAIRGRETIEARLAEQMTMMTERQIAIERADLGGSGDLAYAIGTYSIEMGMEGAPAPMTDSGKYLTLARRDADGSWRIHAHIWNTSRSEAEVAEELSQMAEMSGM